MGKLSDFPLAAAERAKALPPLAIVEAETACEVCGKSGDAVCSACLASFGRQHFTSEAWEKMTADEQIKALRLRWCRGECA
jgi:hypothetical protein